MLPLRWLNALFSHIPSHLSRPTAALLFLAAHPASAQPPLSFAMEVSSITQTAGFRAPVSYIMEALTNDKQVRDEDKRPWQPCHPPPPCSAGPCPTPQPSTSAAEQSPQPDRKRGGAGPAQWATVVPTDDELA